MHCCMLTVRAGTVIVKSKTRPTYFGPGYTKLGISESKCHRCFLPPEKQKYIKNSLGGTQLKQLDRDPLTLPNNQVWLPIAKNFATKMHLKYLVI